MAGSSSEGRTSRTRSVGTKISDEDYARLEASAAASGLTVGEWRREVLLKASGQPAPLATPTEETLLSELLALRTILLNLFYDVASGEPPNRERMQSAHREGRRRHLTSASATNGNWGEQDTFDNFGNLTGKTPTAGSAPALSASYNPSTNQQAGASYDANGNPTPSNSFGGPTYTWNVENRLSQSTAITGIYQPTSYAYDPWGRRVWTEVPGVSGGPNTGEIYFYGATGQKLETYTYSWGSGGFASGLAGINIYFGGKLLQSKGVWVATDRLGSVRANSNGESMSYWLYGEERTNTANDREKFGTYMRDGVGQDYAEQRYYNSNVGAFWTPDPGGIKTANPSNPLSWNRYAYAKGNPIGRFDPHGLEDCDPDDGEECQESYCDLNPEDPICNDLPTGGGGSPAPSPPPSAPCWAQTGNIDATLTELGENIEEVAGSVISNGGELAALTSVITGDINSEMLQIGAMIAAGGPPTGTDFVGGHFNLILGTGGLAAALGAADFTAFKSVLGGHIDGTRQGAVYGNAAQGNYTLHSKQHGGTGTGGYFNAHFDIYNPATDVVSAIGHLFGDVFAGHIGSPCLYPAWN